MSDYEIDILDWSEHQAALLRRAAAGERINDLDWPNVIEEIESVGLSELRSVEGDMTVCPRCGVIGALDEDLNLRLLDEEELAVLAKAKPGLTAALRTVARLVRGEGRTVWG